MVPASTISKTLKTRLSNEQSFSIMSEMTASLLMSNLVRMGVLQVDTNYTKDPSTVQMSFGGDKRSR